LLLRHDFVLACLRRLLGLAENEHLLIAADELRKLGAGDVPGRVVKEAVEALHWLASLSTASCTNKAGGRAFVVASALSAVDPVKAYASMRLAAHFGNPGAEAPVAAWRTGLTPAEVAEADRQYASWQPDPCAGTDDPNDGAEP
jgi:hypothetical protein